MAKKELFKNPLAGFFLRSINAFAVDRDNTDLQSFRTALALLKSGGALGIFAQGTRLEDAEMKDAKAGTAMFALKTGALVIPVGISGSYKLRGKVSIKYGKPLDFSEYGSKKIKRETLNDVTEIIAGSINDILSGF